jgi:hypothetical protein
MPLVALQSAAPDRLTVQRGQDEEPMRRRQLIRGCGDAAPRIEARVEARGKLFKIASETVLRRRTFGIHHL